MGGVRYVSTITWNCTTGAVIRVRRRLPLTLSHLLLWLLSLTLPTLGRMRFSRR